MVQSLHDKTGNHKCLLLPVHCTGGRMGCQVMLGERSCLFVSTVRFHVCSSNLLTSAAFAVLSPWQHRPNLGNLFGLHFFFFALIAKVDQTRLTDCSPSVLINVHPAHHLLLTNAVFHILAQQRHTAGYRCSAIFILHIAALLHCGLR